MDAITKTIRGGGMKIIIDGKEVNAIIKIISPQKEPYKFFTGPITPGIITGEIEPYKLLHIDILTDSAEISGIAQRLSDIESALRYEEYKREIGVEG